MQETEQSSFVEIVDDSKVFDVLNNFIDENEKQLPQARKIFENFVNDQLADLKDENKNFDISQIYISGGAINTISNKWFADWNTIRSLFIEKEKKKLPDFVSLQEIKEKLRGIENTKEKSDFFRAEYGDFFEKEDDYYKIFLLIWQKEFFAIFDKYKKSLNNVEKMIKDDRKYTDKKGFRKDNNEKFILDDNGEKKKFEIQKDIIREYAESALSIYQMMKYFALESGEKRNWNADKLEEDSAFYNPFIEYYENSHTWQYFNVFRNYLTQKPYKRDKIKLNFENGTLLDGWPDSPEGNTQYKSFIFKNKNKYFLGITDYSRILDREKFPKIYNLYDKSYEKMIYKQLDGKTIYGSLYSGEFGTKYSDDKEVVSNNELMSRVCVILEKRVFIFPQLQGIIDKIKSNQYDDPKKIATDISKLNLYSIVFVNVSADYIEQGEYKIGNDLKHLYLFEIHNKDFAEKTSGSKNLHTMYWEEIFSDENLKNPIIKLNGQAEIFFRKASLKKEIDEKRKAPHAVTKNKRYTEDRIFFHCPLTLNFTKDELKKDKEKYKGKADSFSIKVREYLANNKDINIIGIDRGEKHLAYYSVINQDGEIIDTGSFNEINGKDYHKILDDMEKDRGEARLTWQAIGKIKEMKKGYVSQVVKKICDLMVEHNAIVVFEDLNVGFKRGRFAIEKQVYQNLELALAKKLNYLVFKDKKRGESGHYTKALQLTPEIANFKDIYKQCGFMFYIPASYTSAMCPICGFRKNIPTPTENKEKNKEYLEKFDIVHEEKNNRFRFSYILKNVIDEKNKKEQSDGFKLFEDVIEKNNLVFYSNVDRLQFQRNKDNRGGEMKWKNPHQKLKDIFEKTISILMITLISRFKRVILMIKVYMHQLFIIFV
ncbi:MAG: hypothetical protein COZ85_00360 [Candidatus Moranbacteria bacterium CG_4_8_14_3_um_filter_34_16]|nr:MAG: hypothetical protein COZ85_00360 [Candidatus Moranbacteria bacterium CG_4_8_14_3_um_filter_34_16]